jgi:hypothetical protein
MSSRDQIVPELDRLIQEGTAIVNAWPRDQYGAYRNSQVPEQKLRAFRTAAVAAVVRVAGAHSEYYAHLPPIPDHQKLRVDQEVTMSTLGVLMALRDAVDRGLLASIEQRVRSNTYDDFLEQAHELLKAPPSYQVAAMVLSGGVVEDHLRKMCLGRKIEWNGKDCLSSYNQALKDVVYPQATWRRIQVLGDNRNAAAHGGEEAAKLKHDDVEDDLRWARKFMAEYVG